MTTKQLALKKPPEFAVSGGATTPDPGGTAARGAWAWSTTATKPIYWDGAAWQVLPSGGAGSPGGPTNAVQYNNAGSFGGEAAFSYDPATNVLTVDNISSFTAQGDINIPRNTQLTWRNGTSLRWEIYADNGAESGGNVGTDFRIVPFDDAGASLGYNLLTLERGTGRLTHQVKDGTNNAVHSVLGNVDGPISLSVSNGNTGSSTQARVDLSTGIANAYCLFYIQNGATPYSEITQGAGLTGGMYFTTGDAAAPIILRHAGTERLRLQTNIISADFSSALGTRQLLRTSSADANSDVGITPNGSGSIAVLSCYGSSDPANASIGALKATTGDAVSLESLKTGSGSLLAIKFKVDGSMKFAMDGTTPYFPDVTEPAAPSATNTRFFGFNIANKSMPAWKAVDGYLNPVQASLAFGYKAFTKPGNTTTISSVGLTLTNVGTVSTPTLSSANKAGSTRRYIITSAASAGAFSSHYGVLTEVWRGNAAGLGGFFYACRFHLSVLQSGMRAFVGLADVITAPTNVDPTTNTTPGKVGLAINTNTGNWNLVYNVTGAAPTVVALGANFPVDATTLLELVLHCPGNGGDIGYRITNVTTGSVTSGTLTTNIPATTTFLARSAWACTNAATSAVAVGYCGQYIESNI